MTRRIPASGRDSSGYYPSFDAVRDLPSTSGRVAIQRDILADLDTPVSAFLKVREGRPELSTGKR